MGSVDTPKMGNLDFKDVVEVANAVQENMLEARQKRQDDKISAKEFDSRVALSIARLGAAIESVAKKVAS